jgi:hypothetical protein
MTIMYIRRSIGQRVVAGGAGLALLAESSQRHPGRQYQRHDGRLRRRGPVQPLEPDGGARPVGYHPVVAAERTPRLAVREQRLGGL